MGGMIGAIETNYIRREIADAAYRYSEAVERGDKKLVGVTDFVDSDEDPIELLKIGDETERQVVAQLGAVKAQRDEDIVSAALRRITVEARARRNVMPALIEGAKAYATVGEMVGALEAALGRFDTGQVA